jgi:3alpha(or 20beta)-hydroxysteroid dehydrogenase
MGKLDGRTAIVTGAASGQGEAEARLFASEGACVVVGDVNDDGGRRVASEIGDLAHFAHLDVSDPDDWSRVVAETESRFGPISGLVNNAAINSRTGGPVPFEEVDLAEFRQVLDVNLVGQFIGIKAVLPSMKRAGGGAIVNVSSTAGFRATWGLGPYTTSKFGVRGLTKSWAIELGQYNIRVNSLHPGGVDTPMRAQSGRSAEFLAGLDKARAVGRVGQPIEIARLALFLISDDSSFSPGAAFVAAGGMVAGVPRRD